jgi:ribosome maturation factor RimP
VIQKEEKLFNMLAEPIKNKGYELFDIEFKRQNSQQIIQLYIDSPNGIGIEDCVTVNQVAQEILEDTDPNFEDFTLEVSSPGIFRKLKTPEHFKSSTGKRVKVHLQEKIHGISNATGDLQECTTEKICIKLESDGSNLTIPFSLIAKANLAPILKF